MPNPDDIGKGPIGAIVGGILGLLSGLQGVGAVGQRVQRKTRLGYEGLMRRHVIPHLGTVPLQHLTPQHLSSLYSKLLTGGRLDGKAGGLSPRTVS